MDLMQAIVSVGAVVATAAVTTLRKSGKDEKQMESVKEVQAAHGKRLDEHDDRFDELNVRFVPRQELTERMDAIRESQRRTERMVEALILPRVRPIVTGDDTRT